MIELMMVDFRDIIYIAADIVGVVKDTAERKVTPLNFIFSYSIILQIYSLIK